MSFIRLYNNYSVLDRQRFIDIRDDEERRMISEIVSSGLNQSKKFDIKTLILSSTIYILLYNN